MKSYRTITGRVLDMSDLSVEEESFLRAVRREYAQAPEWSRFAAWWIAELKAAGLPAGSLGYRICQDLEARLGIAQGKVAPPDYRDTLADLIEERFGSRHRFCRETGLDPGHLSRVLAGRSDLSLRALQRVLEPLGASLVIQRDDELTARFAPERAARELTGAAG